MSSTRLFVLGALARGGPMHGHQIRQTAQTDRTELWTDIKVGSLYGALHRMAAEGVIEEIRTEQEGNLPARTIYGITDDGRLELASLRDAALRDTRLATDPVDLALQLSQDVPTPVLTAAVRDRLGALAAELARWARLREVATPHLTTLEALGFDHTLMRLETEVAWHEKLLAALPVPEGAAGVDGATGAEVSDGA
ncbi:PadR family transcriptional regulator [Sphaerisporangium sp. TRM90804]|nr:PadR family transcriptional regulator [Sphaerisporangium sp. TRM90804]MDH2427736.1 PadR family transcriptional regulator [Sphaerisporangium sp. TRM90804]